MSFLEITDEEVASLVENSGGKYISETGLYTVKIVRCAYNTAASGYKSVDFTFDYNGNERTVYGLGLYNKDGKENYMMSVFKQLMTICNIKKLESPKRQNIAVKTKDGIVPQEMLIFDQLKGKEVQVAIVKVWNKYQGTIRSKLIVNKFYSVDGFTGKEIAARVTEPTQIDKDLAYLKDRYSKGANDAVTEEEVKAFLGQSVDTEIEVYDDENPFI